MKIIGSGWENCLMLFFVFTKSLGQNEISARASWLITVFIWSQVAETTLPPSYPGRDIFPLICLKNYINRLHEVGETTREGETTRGGELSRLGR